MVRKNHNENLCETSFIQITSCFVPCRRRSRDRRCAAAPITCRSQGPCPVHLQPAASLSQPQPYVTTRQPRRVMRAAHSTYRLIGGAVNVNDISFVENIVQASSNLEFAVPPIWKV